MRIVLTGGAGFVGSHVAERLASDGHQVVVYDAFTKQYPPSVKRRNVAAAVALPGCTLVEGDILDDHRFDSLFSVQAVDAIVHLAASGGRRSQADAAKACIETNVLGTQHVLDRCRAHNVPRLILASSSWVYGLRRDGPCKESDPTDRPLSLYAATKKAAESLAWLAHHRHGTNVLVLRPFSVYGPRQRSDQAIHGYARAIAAGEPVEIPGDGTATVDLVHVADVVDAVARGLEAAEGFDIVNVGSGRPLRLLELVERLGAAFGTTPAVTHGPADPELPPVNWADVSKAEHALGWRPTTDLDDGLRRFAGWLRAEEFADEA